VRLADVAGPTEAVRRFIEQNVPDDHAGGRRQCFGRDA
jgi:hypothetical protein